MPLSAGKTPNKTVESAGKTNNEKQPNEVVTTTAEEVKSVAATKKQDREQGKIDLNELAPEAGASAEKPKVSIGSAVKKAVFNLNASPAEAITISKKPEVSNGSAVKKCKFNLNEESAEAVAIAEKPEVANGYAVKKGMGSRSEDGILLRGVPNEIGTLCIARIPHIDHSSLRYFNFLHEDGILLPGLPNEIGTLAMPRILRTNHSSLRYFNFLHEDGILLPGLPNEIGTICIARVPHIYHSSLRSVNLQWRKLIDSQSFLSLRKELGFANSSLFLVPSLLNDQEVLEIKFEEEQKILNCWQIDLDLESHRCSKPPHSILSIKENTLLKEDRKFSEWVAVDRVVMMIGGNITRGSYTSTVSDVYMFNTVTREWRKGPNMHNSRFTFAYGVIEGRLYVAGGGLYAEGEFRNLKEAEVFDPQTHLWTRIASLPIHMEISQYFVMEGSLYVIGCEPDQSESLHAFSYKPLEDRWQTQQWLVNIYAVCKNHTHVSIDDDGDSQFFIVTTSDNSIYYEEVSYYNGNFPISLKNSHICRYDRNSFRWEQESLVSFCDLCRRSDRCSGFLGCNKLFGLKDKVLIVEHLKDAENAYDVRIRCEGNVVIVALECPDRWHAVLLNV